ncbi:MAG TPA: hypothetical protein VMJ34_10790 [Bryobacteraceae bacterium]|nr:hypothetical protein [Bryobacteraceae bacterium]
MKTAILLVLIVAVAGIGAMKAPVQMAIAGTAFLAGGVVLSITAPFWRRHWKR